MSNDFYDLFKNDANSRKLPSSVAEILKRDLPEGYQFEYDEDLGHFIAVPEDKSIPQTFELEFDKETLAQLPDWAKTSSEALCEYLYRTQKTIKVSITNLVCKDGTRREISALLKDPFSGKGKLEGQFIKASPFPKIPNFLFETESGKKREICFERKPCESRDSIVIESVNTPGIFMRFVIPEKCSDMKPTATMKVDLSSASTIADIVIAWEMLLGHMDGTLKINGHKVGAISPETFDKNTLEGRIHYWQKIEILEGVLGVRFDPKEKMSSKDDRLLNELVFTLVDRKICKYTEPYEYVHINEDAVKDPVFKKEIHNSQSPVALSFIRGPEKYNLLGTEFDLFKASTMKDVRVSYVETDEEGAKIHIESFGTTPWTLFEMYAKTEDDAKRAQKWVFDKLVRNKVDSYEYSPEL